MALFDSGVANKLLSFASHDKDFDPSQMQQFDQYLSNFSNQEEKIKSVESKIDFSIDQNFYSSRANFSIGDSGDLRGLARPGMGAPSLSNDKLSNSPWTISTTRSDEVYRGDKIPLEVYRKMAIDPSYAIGMYLILGLISACKYTIECSDPVVKHVIEHLYQRHHSELIRNTVNNSWQSGFTFAEKVWMRDQITLTDPNESDRTVLFQGPVTTLRKLKFLDPLNNFKFYKDKYDELDYVKQQQSGRGAEEVRVNRNKLFWFALDGEYSSIFGKSRFKSSYSNWYYDKIDYQYLLIHLQNVGSPRQEMRYPVGRQSIEGVQIENDQIAREIVQQARANGGTVLPSTRDDKGNLLWSLEYKEPAQVGIDHYISFLNFNEEKKFQGLGIPAAILMSGSNFSEADAKIDVFMLMLEDSFDQIETAIQKDIIDYLVSYNFGPTRISEVTFKIDRAGLGRRKMLKEIMVNMLRVGSSDPDHHMKFLPDVKKGFEEMGISVMSHEDFFSVSRRGELNFKDMEIKMKVAEAGIEAQKQAAQNKTDLGNDAQRDEDSNGKDRLTPDDRDRDRSSSRKQPAQGG